MKPEEYFDFEWFDTPYGKVERIRLKGHRIDLEHVLEYTKQDYTPERIVGEVYPSLSVAQVQAGIDYYTMNRDRVAHYLAEGDRIGEAYYQDYLKQPNPLRDRLMALKAAQEKKSHEPATLPVRSAHEAPGQDPAPRP